MNLLWVIPMGLIVGIALGTLGGGGSIMTVPVLVYLLNQPPTAATTGSLIIVGVTSLFGLLPHARRGDVQWTRGIVFGLLGIAGSYLGTRLAAGVPPHVLLSAFAGLMLVVAALMYRRLQRGRGGGVDDHRARPVQVVLAATGVGLLTGFFGVGGGFAVVPALVLALGLSMPTAVGTSLLVIAINSASAFAARLGAGITLDWPVIAAFAAFAVVGSLLGGRLSARLSHRRLTQAFIVMLVAVAAYMAVMNVPQLFA